MFRVARARAYVGRRTSRGRVSFNAAVRSGRGTPGGPGWYRLRVSAHTAEIRPWRFARESDVAMRDYRCHRCRARSLTICVINHFRSRRSSIGFALASSKAVYIRFTVVSSRAPISNSSREARADQV